MRVLWWGREELTNGCSGKWGRPGPTLNYTLTNHGNVLRNHLIWERLPHSILYILCIHGSTTVMSYITLRHVRKQQWRHVLLIAFADSCEWVSEWATHRAREQETDRPAYRPSVSLSLFSARSLTRTQNQYLFKRESRLENKKRSFSAFLPGFLFLFLKEDKQTKAKIGKSTSIRRKQGDDETF